MGLVIFMVVVVARGEEVVLARGLGVRKGLSCVLAKEVGRRVSYARKVGMPGAGVPRPGGS